MDGQESEDGKRPSIRDWMLLGGGHPLTAVTPLTFLFPTSRLNSVTVTFEIVKSAALVAVASTCTMATSSLSMALKVRSYCHCAPCPSGR